MKPLVTFPDPEAAVALYLRGLGIADTVTTSFPSAGLSGTAKHLQVELEAGGVADYPVTERAQVRVTAYTAPGQRTAVKDLASLAHGHICRLQSDDVAGVAPRIGRSDVITDPTTKNLMCWFVVRVDLKANVLAS
jgi:hypothetical protein